nr:MAG TPA: hypothetical protein [Caudoviricetes sp.]
MRMYNIHIKFINILPLFAESLRVYILKQIIKN